MALQGNLEIIIALSAAGRPQAEIAQAADVGIRTLFRRLQDPEVQAAIATARLEIERAALGQYLELRTAALGQLHKLVADEDASVRLRAIKIILSSGHAHQVALREDRTGQLEQALAQLRADLAEPGR